MGDPLPVLKCIVVTLAWNQNPCLGEIHGGSCHASVWQPIVEVDILELSRFACRGVGLCHTSIGLGLVMVKEIDMKLTLGMAERR